MKNNIAHMPALLTTREWHPSQGTFVAFSASVTRSFFSFTSTSLPPPIFSTATPPLSLARRSCQKPANREFFNVCVRVCPP